jgi:CheY-like chemotaxis protein
MGKKAVILLAADRGEQALAMRNFFATKYAGTPFYHVWSGAEATAYLAGTGKYGDRMMYPMPDLVLLMLKEPPLDSFGVTKWIEQQKGLEGVKVVVLANVREALQGVQRIGSARVRFWAGEGDFQPLASPAEPVRDTLGGQ